MGFFSVLRDADSSGDFEIDECHVNMWCLAGLFGRRLFTWDVGLRIRATSAPVQKLRIDLPSGTDKEGFEDLFQLLRNQETAQLIFGKPVKISGNSIDWGSGPVALSPIDVLEAKQDEKRSTGEFSIWSLKLSSPVQVGNDAYFRCRIQVSNIGRCWTWKQYALARYGFLLDLRFSDVREAWNVTDGETLQSYMLPMKKLNFFVVLPSVFTAVATSPPFHYARVLEGHAWQGYLKRKTRLIGKEKLTIYQWRNQKDLSVAPETPVRIYLDVRNPVSLINIPNLLVYSVGLILITATGAYLAQTAGLTIPRLENFIVSQVRAHIPVISGAVILAVAAKFIKTLEIAKNVILKARTLINRLERKLFFRST
jgi:hypothetical protein